MPTVEAFLLLHLLWNGVNQKPEISKMTTNLSNVPAYGQCWSDWWRLAGGDWRTLANFGTNPFGAREADRRSDVQGRRPVASSVTHFVSFVEFICISAFISRLWEDLSVYKAIYLFVCGMFQLLCVRRVISVLSLLLPLTDRVILWQSTWHSVKLTKSAEKQCWNWRNDLALFCVFFYLHLILFLFFCFFVF